MPGGLGAAGPGVALAEVAEPTGLDPECPAGVVRKQRLVVRCDQRGDAPAVEVAKNAHDPARRILVEVGRRLIGDQDGRAVDDCPRDGQPLLFAARELDGIDVLLGRQADFFERGPGPGMGAGGRKPGDGERQEDIGDRAAVIQQVRILQDDPDSAAQVRSSPGGKLVQALTVDLDSPPGRRFKTANHLEQRRFAGPGRARNQDELPRRYPKIDIGEDIPAMAIGFEDVLEFDHGEFGSMLNSNAVCTRRHGPGRKASGSVKPPIGLLTARDFPHTVDASARIPFVARQARPPGEA